MRPSSRALMAVSAVLALAAPESAFAQADPLADPANRRVREAFPVGGMSLFDRPQPRNARGAACADSAISGMAWCVTGTGYETAEGGSYSRTFGYNLDAAGRVVYTILTRKEYPLAREKYDETLKALGARYGKAPTKLTFQGKTADGDELQSLVAYWGDIKLVRLNPAELRIVAQTGGLARGPLVDHRQDLRLSARQGDPVYKIEGKAGFIAEFRSVTDVRTDYVLRAVYQPGFTADPAAKPDAAKPDAPKPEAAAPKFRELPLDPGFAGPLRIIKAEQDRLAAIERAKREEEERKAAEERARREEIERKAAEARRAEEERVAAIERARREEEERKAAEIRRAAEAKAAEEKRIADAKLAEERRIAEERRRREAAERAIVEERIRREEAERKAIEARRLAEERARREEAERKAAEARRIAEERARLEEVERKAAVERRAIEERARKAEAEYRASLERAQRAEAERRAAEERARQAEAERRAAEDRARKIEAERKAAEERRAAEEKRYAEERRAADERRAAEERRFAEERRSIEERFAEAARRAAEDRKRAAERKAAEERASAERPKAERPAAAAPPAETAQTPEASRTPEPARAPEPERETAKPEPGEPARPSSPPQFAGPVPGVGGPAASREEWLRMAIAQSRNTTANWVFERVRDRISDDVVLRARGTFAAAAPARFAIEIAFDCNVDAGKRLAAHVRAYDQRTNAALRIPPEDGRAGVVRGNVTLDEEVPQTAFLFPERDERQASIVEIPLAHDDIRRNTPRAQAWLRHYRVALKFRVDQGEATATIHPYADNLRRVLEACGT